MEKRANDTTVCRKEGEWFSILPALFITSLIGTPRTGQTSISLRKRSTEAGAGRLAEICAGQQRFCTGCYPSDSEPTQISSDATEVVKKTVVTLTFSVPNCFSSSGTTA